MTEKETIILALNIVIFVIVNSLMYKRKGKLYDSKKSWIYFMGVQATIILPAFLTALQLYIFAYKFVEKLGNPMFHMVMYCYLGYLILIGFTIFMEENQVNLMRIVSVIMVVYQCLMAYQLINNKEILLVMLDNPANLFRFGDTMGYFLCMLGPILSVGGCVTAWHYWKENGKQNFTF